MKFFGVEDCRRPEVDHIKPIGLGGQSLGFDNHQVLCQTCHKMKTKKDMANITKFKKENEMKNKKILVLKLDDEYVDGNGDIMTTDAKVEFLTDIPLVSNFKKDKASQLGTAQLFREGDEFYIKSISLFETPLAKELTSVWEKGNIYPAIGGMMKRRDGKKVVDFSINKVSLSSDPNVDHKIKSIKEQLEMQND